MVQSNSNRARAINAFVRRLRGDLPDNIVDLRLFGSEARGDATPESDIDVLVVVQPEHERATLEIRVMDMRSTSTLSSTCSFRRRSSHRLLSTTLSGAKRR
jgi:predicted nucleotidyltransferase